jgi:hypothetical protein
MQPKLITTIETLDYSEFGDFVVHFYDHEGKRDARLFFFLFTAKRFIKNFPQSVKQ